MSSLEVRDIIKVSINEICVNPENPRHDIVINLDEVFVMQQLVKTKKDSQAMYKLICDIYNAGWFPQSIVTVMYDEEKKKYIAWDGNRRLTALKILQNPTILDVLTNFTYIQRNKINDMHKQINDNSFYEVSCYVAASFEECADYIRTIHTTDTGALPWNDVAIKRFENKLGIKNMFSQLKEYCGKPFDDISDNFSVNKFEKIANSKVGKEYLKIDNTDNILTHTSSIEELKEKLSKIIKDINDGTLKNKNIKNATEMKKYLYGQEEQKISIEEKDVIVPSVNNLEKTKDINKTEQNNETKVQAIDSQISFIKPNSYELIKRESNSIFIRINIDKLKKKNPRAIGIQDLCYEIQQMCINNHNKKYNISFAFLIRSLLEQSAIYFLINKKMWEKLKKGYASKDLKLEQIIKEIEKRKSSLFDINTLRCWETFNDNTSTKDYFDMIVHHPYLVRSNIQTINNMSDNGLFAIIQYFIDN